MHQSFLFFCNELLWLAHHKIIINIGHSQNRSIEVLFLWPTFIVILSKFSYGYGRKHCAFGEHIGNMLGTSLAPIGNMVETPKYRKMEPPPSQKNIPQRKNDRPWWVCAFRVVSLARPHENYIPKTICHHFQPGLILFPKSVVPIWVSNTL